MSEQKKEVTAIKLLTTEEAISTLAEIGDEFARFYSSAGHDPERRQRLARWLVAVEMGAHAIRKQK